MKNTLIVLLALGMLLLAGCTGVDSMMGLNGERTTDSSGGSTGIYGGPAKMMAAPYASGAVADYAPAPSYGGQIGQTQQLIKTANAQIEVPTGTVQDRFSKFKAAILADGGQIDSADYSETESTKEYYVQVKISPQKFEGLAAMLQGIGTVKAMSTNVNDVSEQYVDVQTRIKNLELQRDQLLGLYNRSGNLSDLLQIEQEITRVQTDIESYQNQKLNLDRQIANSRLSVRIYEQALVVDKTTLDPLGSVVNAFLSALVVAILVIAGLLGVAIPVAIVFGILYWLYRKWRPKKDNKAGKK
jgi:hypothetical protein